MAATMIANAVTVTLEAPRAVAQGADLVATAAFAVAVGQDGGTVNRLPDDAVFRVRWADGTTAAYRRGEPAVTAPDGGRLRLQVRAQVAGRCAVRVEGTVQPYQGPTVAAASDDAYVYVRRSAFA